MTPLERDKLRIFNLLKFKREEAFTVAELSTLTGLDTHRCRDAVDALVTKGTLKAHDGYFLMPK